MLVLSRKKSETIVFNLSALVAMLEEGRLEQVKEAMRKPIEVMVVDLRGDKARLGFKADKNIEVHREEIHLKIQKEKEGAA
jgi:carbon storage regulator CsrA